MTILRTVAFRWNATEGVMVPEPRFRTLAKRQFANDTVYVLDPQDAISHADRGAYFAAIRSAWKNLDANATARYPTPEHLRKWCLIKAGWRKENYAVCDSEDRAIQLAAFIRNLDDFAVVVVKGKVVRTYVARSQKIGRPEDGYMDREEWRRSREDVLAILSGHIGITPKVLEAEGRLNND